MTGMVLKNRYCVLEPVGAGGNGRLYLARDMELGGFWAVKELPLTQKREAKLLRMLEHPNLPRMVDYLEKGDFCYLVMEYIRGKSLAKWLEEGRRFSLGEILDFGITAAQVLAYLHSRKPPVFYGDLKPENLMLTEQGRLCLVDFGSAVFGYSTHQSVCRGTPGYAAPEQYAGRMSRASDVYALGRTLRRLLGGRWYLRSLGRPRLFFFLLRCCRREETRRYPDMEAVLPVLKRIRKSPGKRKYAAGAAAVLGGIILWTASQRCFDGNPDFWQTLTEVTDVFYTERFLNGTAQERQEICRQVEEKLSRMLQDYTGEEEQAHLLRLLQAGQVLEEEGEDEDEKEF